VKKIQKETHSYFAIYEKNKESVDINFFRKAMASFKDKKIAIVGR
jgi:hypothetical protein